jgi:hypothetical protein
VKIQSFSSSSEVKAGHTADFVVWVWSTKAEATGVTLTAHVASALDIGKPSFSICPVAHGTTCKVGNVPVGQADELEIGVKVSSGAGLGEQVQLSATARAPSAKAFTGSATDVVVVNSTGVSATPTLPVTNLPPPSTLPTISGTGVSPGDPGNLFPTVGASTTPPGSGSLGLPKVKPKSALHVQDASATVPVDTRLIGGQLAGLAVLAGAVAIAIARLSLRAPKTDDEAAKKG